MAPPIIRLDKEAIVSTPEFLKLSGALGAKNAWWLLWTTAYIESGFRNYPYRGPKIAMGVFQILPSTADGLSSTWGLPPYSESDITLQARYALAHLWTDYTLFKKWGPPPLVLEVLPPRSSPLLKTLLSIRAFYHGGPAIKSADAKILRTTRPDGRTVKSEIAGALKKLMQKYYESIS